MMAGFGWIGQQTRWNTPTLEHTGAQSDTLFDWKKETHHYRRFGQPLLNMLDCNTLYVKNLELTPTQNTNTKKSQN